MEGERMNREILVDACRASQWTMETNTADVTHTESLRAPAAGGNCLNWIAGHILVSRGAILRLLDGKSWLSAGEEALYARGSAGLAADGPAVDFGRLREGLRETGQEITRRLADMAEERLAEELDPSNFPARLTRPTRGAFLTLLLFHESYHAGQLGIGRRLLGKSGMIG
jgi:uncharacterized damage-inducible protein DinB